uniref:No apical meristem-associated C-terminal domain-containing protein n=1 Tax=Oryza rufipogon TaxID=4529 RepID=A0A0E0RFP2_ORYRU
MPFAIEHQAAAAPELYVRYTAVEGGCVGQDARQKDEEATAASERGHAPATCGGSGGRSLPRLRYWYILWCGGDSFVRMMSKDTDVEHKLRNSPKFQTLESHKRPRSRKSSTPIDRAGEEDEGDDASKSTAPDLSQPSAKKRPIGRKQAKEKLKNGGEDGPYKEAMKDLLDAKEKEAKLKEERWKETW